MLEDGLVQACRQEAADPGLCHDEAPMVALASAAILAGGQARRFGGRDKSRLVIEGRPIIVRQMEVLQRVAHDIFIVGPRADLYADLGLPVYADLIPGHGALGGLYTALEVARNDAVLAVACDLPFLDAGLLARLVERSAGHDGAWMATGRGAEPLDCLLPASRAHSRARAASRGRAEGRRPRDDARDGRGRRRGSRRIRPARPPARQRQHAGGLCPDRIVAMMLPVYALVRSRIQSGLERAFGLAPAGSARDRDRSAAAPGARRPGRARRVRAGPPAAQGAAGPWRRSCRRRSARSTASPASKPRPTAT